MLAEIWPLANITPTVLWNLLWTILLLYLLLFVAVRVARRAVVRLSPPEPYAYVPFGVLPEFPSDDECRPVVRLSPPPEPSDDKFRSVPSFSRSHVNMPVKPPFKVLPKLPSDDELSELPFDHGLPELPFSDELSKLSMPKEPSQVCKSEAKKAKKRDKNARRRGGDFGCATVHVTPKSHKKLNLVPAGLSRPDIHGMVNYEMKVLRFLEHGATSMLGISGKRGMGKSTLLRLVHTYSISHGSPFSFAFFAKAGIGFTSGMLRRILATKIGVGPTPAVPSVNLISSFLQCESFILLLDDVRAGFDLADAGLPMPLGPRQKVVFTTRDESICTDMGSSGNIIRMERLAEDVAWDLFRYNVGSEIIDADLEIKDIAKEVYISIKFAVLFGSYIPLGLFQDNVRMQ